MLLTGLLAGMAFAAGYLDNSFYYGYYYSLLLWLALLKDGDKNW